MILEFQRKILEVRLSFSVEGSENLYLAICEPVMNLYPKQMLKTMTKMRGQGD